MTRQVALLGVVLSLAGCAGATFSGYFSTSPHVDPYYSDQLYGPPYSYPGPYYDYWVPAPAPAPVPGPWPSPRFKGEPVEGDQEPGEPRGRRSRD